MLGVLVACGQPISPSSDAGVPKATPQALATPVPFASPFFTDGTPASEVQALLDLKILDQVTTVPPLSITLYDEWSKSYSNEILPDYGVSQNDLVAVAYSIARKLKSDAKFLSTACQDPVYAIDDIDTLISLTEHYTETILWTANQNFSVQETFTLENDPGRVHSAFVGCYRPYWKFDVANVVDVGYRITATLALQEMKNRGFYIADTVGYPYVCFPISEGAESVTASPVMGNPLGLHGAALTTTVWTANFPGNAYLWCPVSIAWMLSDYPFGRDNDQVNIVGSMQESFVEAMAENSLLQERMLSSTLELVQNLTLSTMDVPNPPTIEDLFPYLSEGERNLFEQNGYNLTVPDTILELDDLRIYPFPLESGNYLYPSGITDQIATILGAFEGPGLPGPLSSDTGIGAYIPETVYRGVLESIIAYSGMQDSATGEGLLDWSWATSGSHLPVPDSSRARNDTEPDDKVIAQHLFRNTVEKSSEKIALYRANVMSTRVSTLPHLIGVAAVSSISGAAESMPLLDYVPECGSENCAEGYRFGLQPLDDATGYTLYQSLIQAGDVNQYTHFKPIDDFATDGKCKTVNEPMAQATPVPVNADTISARQECDMTAAGISDASPVFVMADLGNRKVALNGDSICETTSDGFARFTSLTYSLPETGNVQSCSGVNVRATSQTARGQANNAEAPSAVNLWMGPASLYYGYSPSTGDYFNGTLHFIWFDPDQGHGG